MTATAAEVFGPMTASVKRAVMATIDRMRAEQVAEAAGDELEGRVQFELLARASLVGNETVAYDFALSNALEEAQLGPRA